MAYKVVRTEQAVRDLDFIFDHLVESYSALGDAIDIAVERAVHRLRMIDDDMEALAQVPFQGTLRPELMVSLRHVTKNNAIFYFHVDENARIISVLAVFFGGQDHQRHMLARLDAHSQK
ncbi:MAG: type II toxin-antitoxin system RelE/ParE family toxin [Pseudomonadota bacterium]